MLDDHLLAKREVSLSKTGGLAIYACCWYLIVIVLMLLRNFVGLELPLAVTFWLELLTAILFFVVLVGSLASVIRGTPKSKIMWAAFGLHWALLAFTIMWLFA